MSTSALLIVAAVVALALLAVPFVVRQIGKVGKQISLEIDGGRSGTELARYLDEGYLETEGEGAALNQPKSENARSGPLKTSLSTSDR